MCEVEVARCWGLIFATSAPAAAGAALTAVDTARPAAVASWGGGIDESAPAGCSMLELGPLESASMVDAAASAGPFRSAHVRVDIGESQLKADVRLLSLCPSSNNSILWEKMDSWDDEVPVGRKSERAREYLIRLAWWQHSVVQIYGQRGTSWLGSKTAQEVLSLSTGSSSPVFFFNPLLSLSRPSSLLRCEDPGSAFALACSPYVNLQPGKRVWSTEADQSHSSRNGAQPAGAKDENLRICPSDS